MISTNDLYGGSYRLLDKIYKNFGIVSHFVDMTTAENIVPLINSNTKLIWIETPTNPMLNIIDIAAICKIAKSHDLLVCVDNTFASPYLQNPLDLGADLVHHSVTKYIGGHSDVVMGAVIVRDAEMAEQLHFIQNAAGAVPGPMDCFLVLRGIKTLHLRMQAACNNARTIAAFLQTHPKVGKVYYPGLDGHPGRETAKEQMRDFGAMVSFTLASDNFDDAVTLMKKLNVFAIAESLGGVESLIGHPASMTHASIPREERLKTGLTDSLLRLSVGVEDGTDLIADLKQALE